MNENVQNWLQRLAWLVKLLALLDISGVTQWVGPKYAMVVFFGISTLKDGLILLGDWLDDGVINKSWKGAVGMLAVGLILFSQVGCAKLAPGGVYNGDKYLYRTDQSITAADRVMHAFVKWEYENRTLLRGTPQVTMAADQIRKNADVWVATAIGLREAYASNPTAEGKKKLDSAMDILRQAIQSATLYLQTPAAAGSYGAASPPPPPVLPKP